jgi:hypothetical protein
MLWTAFCRRAHAGTPLSMSTGEALRLDLLVAVDDAKSADD